MKEALQLTEGCFLKSHQPINSVTDQYSAVNPYDTKDPNLQFSYSRILGGGED